MSQYCVGGVEAGMSLLSRCWDKDIPRLGKEGRLLQGQGMCARHCITVQDYGRMDTHLHDFESRPTPISKYSSGDGNFVHSPMRCNELEMGVRV